MPRRAAQSGNRQARLAALFARNPATIIAIGPASLASYFQRGQSIQLPGPGIDLQRAGHSRRRRESRRRSGLGFVQVRQRHRAPIEDVGERGLTWLQQGASRGRSQYWLATRFVFRVTA